MVLENLMNLCMTRPEFFEKKTFCCKNWGNGPKIGFFEFFLKKLVINFHWICSIIKIYIICCDPAQTRFWEKSCSWDIDQNALSQSDCRINKFKRQRHFLHVDTNWQKSKADQNFLYEHGQEMGVANLIFWL